MDLSPVVHSLADLLPGKNPGSQLKSDCLHSRAASLDVWKKKKYLAHARIRSPDLPARSAVTSLSRLSYSTFLGTNYIILGLLFLRKSVWNCSSSLGFVNMYNIYNRLVAQRVCSLLITALTCFGHRFWPSAVSLQIYRRVQLTCRLMWERFYISMK
jgi:multisubunit Na+/H+ antiporter MnhG subunit